VSSTPHALGKRLIRHSTDSGFANEARHAQVGAISLAFDDLSDNPFGLPDG